MTVPAISPATGGPQPAGIVIAADKAHQQHKDDTKASAAKKKTQGETMPISSRNRVDGWFLVA